MNAQTSDHSFLRQNFAGLTPTPSFSGITSFLRRTLSRDLEDVDLAVTGIPFDSATSNRPGTRFGPRAIREASIMQSHERPYGWNVDPLSDLNVADYGDLWYDYADVAKFPEALRRHIGEIIEQNCCALSLGGDHFVTYPILQAHAEKYGPLSLLQFDAHTDTWKDGGKGRIDHGTMLYHAVKEGLIVAERSVQVGIRTFNSDTLGFKILDAQSVHLNGPLATAREIVEHLEGSRVYLSFDIDALDPAYAPRTGTPIWGGLTSAQVSMMLQNLKGIDLVGMDVVEVSPPYDHSGITALAATHVAIELMCLWMNRPSATGKRQARVESQTQTARRNESTD